jgi:hypothetical protein
LIRLAIAVEGETEEAFVNKVLADVLQRQGVEPTPILLGGDVRVERVAAEMANLYWSFDFVTSLLLGRLLRVSREVHGNAGRIGATHTPGSWPRDTQQRGPTRRPGPPPRWWRRQSRSASNQTPGSSALRKLSGWKWRMRRWQIPCLPPPGRPPNRSTGTWALPSCLGFLTPPPVDIQSTTKLEALGAVY